MDEKKEEMLRKIQKAIALSMDPGAPEGEKDNAAGFAARLMAKYKISMGEVNVKAAETSDPLRDTDEDRSDMLFAGAGSHSHWESYLGGGISQVFECVVIISGFSGNILKFIGMEDDVESCIWFFEAMQMAIGSRIGASEARTVSQKESYAMGMKDSVVQRLNSMYKKMQEMLPDVTKALVVQKKELVSQRVKRDYPRLGKGRVPKSKRDPKWYTKGLVDGQKIKISSGREQITG